MDELFLKKFNNLEEDSGKKSKILASILFLLQYGFKVYVHVSKHSITHVLTTYKHNCRCSYYLTIKI